ncbi:FxsA family protein [Candidatus Mycobacterium methanotrophicum]|uniref:Membrane protein FxsA n=1 Tax=Candidatus Mycobacterium methanotrophicum TaxID=2943498 RepID=A0ABY4QF41_9MYCO|nr:FxsA family protein [Candidatus Mycobacterium methanotrophicum]UQX09419.1 membrane protein FxsA [Candidatus Mycobacterium methanotrophicum]
MVSRLFLLYVVVELAVVLALASTIGLGWTLLLLLVAFVAGITLAGSQSKRQLTRLRSGLTNQQPRVASDGALVALGTVLVVVPGLVTTAAGLLLLLPATRAAVRPVLTAMAARGVGRRAPLITVTTVDADQYASARRPGPDYIDGEVIDVTDVTDVDPPGLPGEPK